MANKRRKKSLESLRVLQPDAAGADIGAQEIFVAVPEDRDDDPVRSFPTFTRDLHAMADWLQRCGIRTIAMESTSVYWIPAHQILEERGIEVYLVNAHYLKNVPGRKSDASDCQWIQYLHSVGLLRGSFRPPAAICAIRSLWRHRESLIQMGADHVRHMQKALDQSNLQLHHVLSDITGVSGQRILDAILDGQRDPVQLAQLCHGGVKNSKETIAKALEGDYRPEHLFALKQALQGYRFYQKMVTEVDSEIQQFGDSA
jgi:transposase